MAEKSILDARLAEIDRRLRTIQSGLAPTAKPKTAAETAAEAEAAGEPIVTDLRPAEPVVPPEAAPIPKRLADAAPGSEAADLVTRLRALVEAHERLLASAGDALAARGIPAPEHIVGVSAGPFANIEALRRFEQALLALPEVSGVTLREYEGADRVIVDVHLAPPTP
jgi:hypothetical protein